MVRKGKVEGAAVVNIVDEDEAGTAENKSEPYPEPLTQKIQQ